MSVEDRNIYSYDPKGKVAGSYTALTKEVMESIDVNQSSKEGSKEESKITTFRKRGQVTVFSEWADLQNILTRV